MALYKKLDLWSIFDGLDKVTDYCYNGNEKESPYWDYYYDLADQTTADVPLYGSHRVYHPVSGTVRGI